MRSGQYPVIEWNAEIAMDEGMGFDSHAWYPGPVTTDIHSLGDWVSPAISRRFTPDSSAHDVPLQVGRGAATHAHGTLPVRSHPVRTYFPPFPPTSRVSATRREVLPSVILRPHGAAMQPHPRCHYVTKESACAETAQRSARGSFMLSCEPIWTINHGQGT